MRYFCTSCGVQYAPKDPDAQPVKTKPGHCPGCWELYLATLRFNNRRMYVDWCKQKGTAPTWTFRKEGA